MRLRQLDPRNTSDGGRDETGAGDRDAPARRGGSEPPDDDGRGTAAGGGAGSTDESPPPESTTRSAGNVSADDLLELLSNRRRRYLWRALRRDDARLELSEASRRIAAWENGVDVDAVEYDERKSVYNSLHQFHCPKMADAGLIEFDKRGSTVRLASELPTQLTVTVEPDTDDVRDTACGALAVAAGVVLGAWTLGLPVFGSLSLAAVGLSLGIGASAALLVYSLFVRTEYGLSLADALSRVDG